MTKKEIKKITINLEKNDINKVEYLMKYFEVGSIQNLFRYLLGNNYGKTKDTILKYGHSTTYEKKSAISDKLNEMRAMSNENLTNYIRTLGYDKFTGEQFIEENDMPPRRIKYDSIITAENGERCWITSHIEENDPERKIVYSYDTFWDIERLFKELLKLKLI